MTRSRVQIVATIGPNSGTEEMLGRLADAGMDIMRLNFSHGTYEEHDAYISNLRKVASARGIRIPIIQDLSGPRGKTADGHAFDSEKAEITEKDLHDLDFGIAHGVEYIAQSYVGSADDIRALRAEMAKRGLQIPVIAKIERQIAVNNADEIIQEADAIMIARGDLGLDVPIEQIPFIEKDLIEKCNSAGKSVITATQMMLSMVAHPEPTRAEVTDVSYAVVTGSDAVMLSEETANGNFPVEAVQSMEKVALEAEKHTPNPARHILQG